MRIPYLSTPDKPLIASTQDFLPIVDIQGGVVIYKTGGASLIMESSSLNFSLLSQREQEAKILAYAGLLNSFKFPVQIVVRSQKKDISSYMDFLSRKEKNIKNQKLFDIMQDHKNFIIDAIKKKNVLSKKFYIVIPFTPYELGITKSFVTTFTPRKDEPLPFPKSYVVRKARIALLPKRDHLMRQARRIGIVLTPLTDEDLIKLFYTTYNPEPPVKEVEVFG